MKLYEKYITEKKPSMKQLALDLAESVMDDMPYQAKERFGGWPEDVVSKTEADEFWKWVYKYIIKLAREHSK